jgi:hypothetical protein
METLKAMASNAAALWIKTSETENSLADACAMYGYDCGFQAGYKAAQEQFADVSKVMPDHNADASKKVDEVSALLDENELVDMKLKRQYGKAYLDLVLSTPGCNPLTSFGVPPRKHDVSIIGEYVEHLEDVIAARSSSGILNNWISVKDRLPPKGEWVLSWYLWGHEVNKLKWISPNGQLDFHRDYYGESESEDGGPTHWMPLPEPPKEDK